MIQLLLFDMKIKRHNYWLSVEMDNIDCELDIPGRGTSNWDEIPKGRFSLGQHT